MMALPLVSCGFLSFVPSVWVAVMRRDDKALMVRSIVVAAVFFLVVVVALVAVGTAPTDEDGSPTGAASDITISLVLISAVVAAVLAFIQREPTKQLDRR